MRDGRRSGLRLRRNGPRSRRAQGGNCGQLRSRPGGDAVHRARQSRSRMEVRRFATLCGTARALPTLVHVGVLAGDRVTVTADPSYDAGLRADLLTRALDRVDDVEHVERVADPGRPPDRRRRRPGLVRGRAGGLRTARRRRPGGTRRHAPRLAGPAHRREPHLAAGPAAARGELTDGLT